MGDAGVRPPAAGIAAPSPWLSGTPKPPKLPPLNRILDTPLRSCWSQFRAPEAPREELLLLHHQGLPVEGLCAVLFGSTENENLDM